MRITPLYTLALWFWVQLAAAQYTNSSYSAAESSSTSSASVSIVTGKMTTVTDPLTNGQEMDGVCTSGYITSELNGYSYEAAYGIWPGDAYSNVTLGYRDFTVAWYFRFTEPVDATAFELDLYGTPFIFSTGSVNLEEGSFQANYVISLPNATLDASVVNFCATDYASFVWTLVNPDSGAVQTYKFYQESTMAQISIDSDDANCDVDIFGNCQVFADHLEFNCTNLEFLQDTCSGQAIFYPDSSSSNDSSPSVISEMSSSSSAISIPSSSESSSSSGAPSSSPEVSSSSDPDSSSVESSSAPDSSSEAQSLLSSYTASEIGSDDGSSTTTSIASACSGTTTITAVPESTTVITITSCSDNACETKAITTGVTVISTTSSGVETEYTTYCPLTGGTETPGPSTTAIPVIPTNSACVESVFTSYNPLSSSEAPEDTTETVTTFATSVVEFEPESETETQTTEDISTYEGAGSSVSTGMLMSLISVLAAALLI